MPTPREVMFPNVRIGHRAVNRDEWIENKMDDIFEEMLKNGDIELYDLNDDVIQNIADEAQGEWQGMLEDWGDAEHERRREEG